MAEPLPAFAAARQESWTDLAGLIRTAKGRVDRLDATQVRRLGVRYREAVADLAQARRRFPHDEITAQLERLVSDGRPLIYAQVTERTSVLEFATTGYWRRVRERPAFLVVATLALWLPIVVVGLWANANPVEAGRVAQISPLTAGLADSPPRDPDTEGISEVGVNASFSSQIFTNNMRVAFVTYAGGLSGGVLTLAALLFNGLVVGLVAGLAINGGYGDSFWRLIVPHGVLELSLITVAGAAGLRTGWALLRPGHRTRAEALTVEGRAGIEMALGTAVLLIPCGLIEGFVTARGISLPMALTVGIGLGVAYWAAVAWCGRPAQAESRYR